MKNKVTIKPGLVVECGSMFSGKSESIKRKGNRYIFAKKKVVFAKPSFYNVYHADSICTHNGERVPAVNVEIETSLLEQKEIVEADVVLIDEIQFFKPKVINDIKALIAMRKRVYVAGLDLDYMAEPFPIMSHLMCIADEVNKHHAVCVDCGEDAYVSHKKTMNTQLVELGHTDLYEALCRSCYSAKMDRWKEKESC